jgi:universal stress protein A
MSYRHILAAVDFSRQIDQITAKAAELARLHGAELSLIHVVENLPVVDSALGPMVPYELELTDQLVENARERLARLAEPLGLAEDHNWLELGSPKAEIIRMAQERGVDLIVLGSHGRHGIGLLLGSTASSVIHHASCDVLAVRLRD